MGYLKESFSFGSTLAVIGLSAPAVVVPPPHCVGGWIQQNSLAAGTLWLGQGLSQIPGGTGMMFLNTTQNPLEFYGPAKFYLYATGATISVGLGLKFSEGVSYPLAGE